MKKEDIRSALERIRPKEELVDRTLANMRIAKEKQKRQREMVFPLPMFNKGARLAGAFCVLLLIVGVCIATVNSGLINPSNTASQPTLADMIKVKTSDMEPAGYSFFDDNGNGWILATGTFKECLDKGNSTENSELDGVVIMLFSVTELNEYSDTLSVDIKKTSADITVCADLGDSESAEEFANMLNTPMLIRATPNNDGTWILLDYSEIPELN